MAKVPLVPDNFLLRAFIKSIEEPDNTSPTISFVSVRFNRPEFSIWVDSSMLRDAAKSALDADLQYSRYRSSKAGFRKFLPGVKTELYALASTRDKFFEDYEFLRKLIAGDNIAIILRKTK
jgi:hypothetical protein